MAGENVMPFLNGEVPVVGADQRDGQAPQVQEFTGQAADTNGGDTIETDVVVIGAGFSGITAIDRLRKSGFNVECFESGEDFGGVWYWNRYPGARVDSEAPFYQLNIPEVYRNWEFSERFPGHQELREYMAHTDKTLDLRKDTHFNARVVDAQRNEDTNKWTMKTQQGHTASGNYCLAMQQRALSKTDQHQMKRFYPALFKAGRDSRAGFPWASTNKSVLDTTKEEREEHFNYCWEAGAFNYLQCYMDPLMLPEANRIVYDYWRKRICQRLTNPAKQKIMAPEKMPYYFGTKRGPLEQDYYEVLDQPNVHLHDLNQTPLKAFTEKGLVMADGTQYEFDTIVLATRFDSFTGSLTKMGLKNKDGVELQDVWEEGVSTYLGLTISGFPNMFMAYTPQAPTALSNGPTIIEAQVETIVDMVKKLESEGAKSIEATRQAEVEWKAMLKAMSKHTLYPFTDSWWNGANIPGKKVENMAYVAGINTYDAQCRATFDGWKGFQVVKGAA